MIKKNTLTMLQAMSKLSNLKGVKFAYAMAKNKNKLQSEVGTIEKALEKLSPEMQKSHKEYEEKRVILARSHAKKIKIIVLWW